MRRLFGGACLAAGLLLAGQAAADVTINFGEAGLTPGFGPDPWFAGNPKGTDLSNQFVGVGALFSVVSGAAYVANSSFVSGCSSLGWDDFLAVNTTPPYGTAQAVMSVVFVDPNDGVTPAFVAGGSVSFRISDINPVPSNRVVVQSLDLNNQVIEQVSLTQYQDVLGFTTGDVAKIQFIDNGSDGFVVDDLSFGAVTVAPEPSTIWALAPLGIGLLARRKARK